MKINRRKSSCAKVLEATPCRLIWAATLLTGFCLVPAAFAQLDTFYLRDGSSFTGNIVAETADAYRTLVQTPTAPMMTNVPVRAVRYVVYGSPQKARANLDLERVARALHANDNASIMFLPPKPSAKPFRMPSSPLALASGFWPIILAAAAMKPSKPSMTPFAKRLGPDWMRL